MDKFKNLDEILWNFDEFLISRKILNKYIMFLLVDFKLLDEKYVMLVEVVVDFVWLKNGRLF